MKRASDEILVNPVGAKKRKFFHDSVKDDREFSPDRFVYNLIERWEVN